tara:strand:- start:4347 stop:4976 length:630 start_codon:yes stop_codon:yes gene_type:complete
MSYNSFDPRQKVKVMPENRVEYLETKNPYIIDQHGEYLLFSTIEMPQELYNKAIKIENMSCGIRTVCVLDIIMGLYYLTYNFILGIVCSLISFNGYLSTIYYKKSLLLCYLLYQYLQVLIKTTNLVVVIYFYNTNQSVIYFNNITNTTSNNTREETISYSVFIYNDPLIDVFIGFVLLGLQLFVTCFIREYYMLLPTNSERKKIKYITI